MEGRQTADFSGGHSGHARGRHGLLRLCGRYRVDVVLVFLQVFLQV